MTTNFDPTLEEFERELAALGDERYELTLFVNGASERSAHAIANVRSLCDNYLAGRFQLNVVDIHEQPELLTRYRILASPTLVKEKPLPVRKLVGDLSDGARVLAALDVQVVAEPRP